jgi:hypothetical protein
MTSKNFLEPLSACRFYGLATCENIFVNAIENLEMLPFEIIERNVLQPRKLRLEPGEG